MKVVHICLCGVYTDGFNYQENLLSKYHKKIGYEVEIICSTLAYSEGNVIEEKTGTFFNKDNIKVTRLDYKHNNKLAKKLGIYKDLTNIIDNAHPNIIFIHGCQYIDILGIVKYLKKHKEITVYVDNHGDYSNSATNFFSKNILHKILWKYTAKSINPYVKKWYGVLPARCDFLTEMYSIPKNKVELLVMGADDEKVIQYESKDHISELRDHYQINSKDFLIVTGGKIDIWKTQTLDLMDAVNELEGVSLIVFGSIDVKLKNIFETKLSKKVKYAGWVDSNESYRLFSIADLVVFPGRHSVYWEQVVAQGKPLLVRYYEGYNHIDCGGNVEYLKYASIEEIKKKIINIRNTNKYRNMIKIADSDIKNRFLYSEIAKKSLKNNYIGEKSE